LTEVVMQIYVNISTLLLTTCFCFQICKVAVSTLSHDQMVDLLKTSMMVTVTVIPPLPDGSPRRCVCWFWRCS